MTNKGAELLADELHNLKRVERIKVIKDIAEARGHGDLKENAEYHAARERQGFIEGRINDIENKLSNANIIEIDKIKNEGKIIFGSTVVLINVETKKVLSYQIVGEDESDIKNKKISYSSPIARALIGNYENEIIEVTTPRGLVTYKVKSVKYVI
jgi:transcription elongation factor GreA